MTLPMIANPLGTCHVGQALWWALCTSYPVLRNFLGTGQLVLRVLPGYVCQEGSEGSPKQIFQGYGSVVLSITMCKY